MQSTGCINEDVYEGTHRADTADTQHLCFPGWFSPELYFREFSMSKLAIMQHEKRFFLGCTVHFRSIRACGEAHE